MLVFITGASSGFGKAMARRFVQGGHQVILLARRAKRLEVLQKELGESCIKILEQDVRDTEAIKNALGSTIEKIDVLINNAGLALGTESAEVCKIEDWEHMIEVNITALVGLTHLIIPFMVKKGSGHIINMGSIAGSYPYPGGNVYGATKAFVKQFSLNLRADFYNKNIRVSDIEPGLSESEFSIVRFKGDRDKADTLYKNANPLKPEDIAESAFWIATLPPHVNINRIEIMPTTQAAAALNVHKNP